MRRFTHSSLPRLTRTHRVSSFVAPQLDWLMSEARGAVIYIDEPDADGVIRVHRLKDAAGQATPEAEPFEVKVPDGYR